MFSTDRIATFFGVGYTIWFPGTAASMLAWALSILLVSVLPHWLLYIVTAVVIYVGWKACADYANAHAKWDASECVIDEVAAVLLIACVMPLFLPAWVVALVVFRIFDIWKPRPIPEIEKMMEPGARIMLDDLAAAIPAIAAGWLTYALYIMIIGL